MGGLTSKNYNRIGGIHIQLEKVVFHGGELISGTIHFSLTQQMLPCYLEFQFKGEEKTRWCVPGGGPGAFYSAKYPLSKVRYVMHTWDTPIDPGHYSVPFTFLLPNDIPGSFNYNSGSHSAGFFSEVFGSANLYYRIHAKLISSNESLKHKEDIHLVQGQTQVNVLVTEQRTAQLRSWGCFKKGNVKFNIHWPQDTYESNEVLETFIEIDNSESRVAIRTIDAVLRYTLRMRNLQGRSKIESNPVMSKKFQVTVNPGDKLVGDQAIKLQMALAEAHKLLVGIHTTKGHLIECSFALEIKINKAGMCTSGDPMDIFSTFNLKPSIFVQPTPIVAPSGWNPQVLPLVALQFDLRNSVIPINAMQNMNSAVAAYPYQYQYAYPNAYPGYPQAK